MKNAIINGLRAGNISRIKRNAVNAAAVDVYIFNPLTLDHTVVTIDKKEYRQIYQSTTGRPCMF